MGRGSHWRRTALPLCWLVAAGGAAAAGDLTGYAEFLYSESETEREDAGGAQRDEISSFLQRYTLNWARQLFPNIDLAVGGLYELTDTSLDSTATSSLDTDNELLFPYARAFWRNPVAAGELAFERQRERQSFGNVPDIVGQRDLYRASFAWRPEKLPETRVDLLRTRESGGSPLRLLRETDDAQLTSEYRSRGLYAIYRGSISNRDERVDNGEVETVSHSGRVRYGHSWLRGRITLGGDAGLDSSRVEQTGTALLEFPVAVAAGLFAIDDTPELGPLVELPALVNGDRSTPTAIDLGVPATPGDDDPRNIGLDLGVVAEEIDLLRLWIDRSLPQAIALSFTFRIFTSADNDIWIPLVTLSAVPLDAFDDRFDLSIPRTAERFVKIVVVPLDPANPQAINFPDILVTELEALEVGTAGATVAAESTDQRLNGSFRARLLEAEALYFESAYFLVDSTTAPSRSTLSNGLSWSRRLARIYDIATRLARIDTNDPRGDSTQHTFSGSLGARPLETLRHNLVLSATRNDLEGAERDFYSVILNNFLEVRRGIDMAVSYGRSFSIAPDDSRTVVDLLTVGVTLEPHRTTVVGLALQDRSVDRTDADPVGSRHNSEVSVSWRPVTALYFYAAHRTDEVDEFPTRATDEVVVGWSPLAEGTLQLSVNASRLDRTEPDSTLTRLSPALRWNITPMMYAEVIYSDFHNEDPSADTDTQAWTGSFRWSF